MFKYAQLNELDMVVSISFLNEEVNLNNMILLEEAANVSLGSFYNRATQSFEAPEPQPEPPVEKDVREIAEEIQEKQARDTLVKFDVLATVFEDLEKNDVIKFEVLATIFETLMELQDKIDNLQGGN